MPEQALPLLLQEIHQSLSAESISSPHQTTAALELLSHTARALLTWALEVGEQAELVRLLDVLLDAVDPNDAEKTRCGYKAISAFAEALWLGDTVDVDIFGAWSIGILERMLLVSTAFGAHCLSALLSSSLIAWWHVSGVLIMPSANALLSSLL